MKHSVENPPGNFFGPFDCFVLRKIAYFVHIDKVVEIMNVLTYFIRFISKAFIDSNKNFFLNLLYF